MYTKETASGFSPRLDIVPFLLFGGGLVLITIAAGLGSMAILAAVAAVVFFSVIAQLIHRLAERKAEISFFLIIPTIMSATQNVYLTTVAGALDSGRLQFAIILNFLFSVALYVVLIATRKPTSGPALRKLIKAVTTCLAILVVYGAATVVLFQHDLVAAAASSRNIVAPFLFLLIGLHASVWARHAVYLRYLVMLGFVAVVFGFIEANTPDFWQSLDLRTLWEKKGISVQQDSGLPKNFFASEQVVPGEFLRRMAGPFADPVNFGTFLFAVFMAAWYLRGLLCQIATVAAMVLAVSKGALLGLIVFFAFWTRYYASRTSHLIALVLLAAGAYNFYLFTVSSSTGSTAAHIGGFTAAFVEFPQHPLGRGLGSSGVLAGLFSEGSESTSAVTESGLGMVIGQLGIVGLAVYLVFFFQLSKYVLQIKNLRDKTLAAGLLGGFLLNAAFNEVALSPNSAAPYFIILGLVIGSDLAAKEELDAIPSLQFEEDAPSLRDLGREGPLRTKQA
ncbi:O-antigen ligase family protein [Pseudarthrobacter sp. NPDC092184]|uniref:O-antigen ligase family protein n=1 Tax=unclassified Pseudarthrobacter TaxID=2647000 RepID=UPI0032EADCC1